MSWTVSLLEWGSLRAERMLDGITATSALGEQLSATRYALDAGAVVPEHAHAAEEFGHVLSGSLRLTVGGDTWTVGPGESFLIRGGVPHSAVAQEHGCDLLECYSPPRSPTPPRSTEGT